jgi:hypothetical protein
MEKTGNGQSPFEADGYHISAKGLQGRQSVRATFRLPEDIIQLLGVMARQLGIQQKSLFDQLMEDHQVLQQVAATLQTTVRPSDNKRQKTFVLSKRSLEILDTVARREHISRDLLVEISIQRLIPLMNVEQEKHRKRVHLYKKMNSLHRQCANLLKSTAEQLGEDDLATELVQDICDVMMESSGELKTLIKKGEALENYSDEEKE